MISVTSNTPASPTFIDCLSQPVDKLTRERQNRSIAVPPISHFVSFLSSNTPSLVSSRLEEISRSLGSFSVALQDSENSVGEVLLKERLKLRNLVANTGNLSDFFDAQGLLISCIEVGGYPEAGEVIEKLIQGFKINGEQKFPCFQTALRKLETALATSTLPQTLGILSCIKKIHQNPEISPRLFLEIRSGLISSRKAQLEITPSVESAIRGGAELLRLQVVDSGFQCKTIFGNNLMLVKFATLQSAWFDDFLRRKLKSLDALDGLARLYRQCLDATLALQKIGFCGIIISDIFQEHVERCVAEAASRSIETMDLVLNSDPPGKIPSALPPAIASLLNSTAAWLNEAAPFANPRLLPVVETMIEESWGRAEALISRSKRQDAEMLLNALDGLAVQKVKEYVGMVFN